MTVLFLLQLTCFEDVLSIRCRFAAGSQSPKCAFRRRSESPQTMCGNVKSFRQLRVWVISVTGPAGPELEDPPV